MSGFVEAGDRGDKGPRFATRQSPRVAVDGGSVADAGTFGTFWAYDAAGDGQATIVPFPCSPSEGCGLGYPVTCCQEIHKPANLPH